MTDMFEIKTRHLGCWEQNLNILEQPVCLSFSVFTSFNFSTLSARNDYHKSFWVGKF